MISKMNETYNGIIIIIITALFAVGWHGIGNKLINSY